MPPGLHGAPRRGHGDEQHWRLTVSVSVSVVPGRNTTGIHMPPALRPTLPCLNLPDLILTLPCPSLPALTLAMRCLSLPALILTLRYPSLRGLRSLSL